ncbi:MAG: hypothetical protein Q4C56_05450 [Peptococcaceae bacterium]|nr:hypothetical protein [Peptococcaceae bacterium]
MRDTLYSSDFLDKDVLNLANGDLTGEIDNLLVAENPLRVAALVVDDAACTYSAVADVDQEIIVVSDFETTGTDDLKKLLDRACLDKAGKVLGKIAAFSWKSEGGTVSELILARDGALYGVDAAHIAKIGSGAVVLSASEDVLEKTTYQGADAQEKSSDDDTKAVEDMLQSIVKRVGTTLSGASQMVGERVKNIDTEEINREVNRFTEKIGKELKGMIETFSEQSKSAKYATMESEILSVLRDLENYTVSAPVVDKNNDPIIIPGQLINDTVARRAIENDKIANLYRVAVRITDGENNE